jgi:hypothetical protein
MSDCQLGRLLVKLFAKGDLAGTTVHDLASAAWLDGWGHNSPLARKLVKAGAQGKARNKIAQAIVKAAESEGLVCSKALPYKVGLSTGGEALVFLPHEFYPQMVQDLGLQVLCLPRESLDEQHGLPKLLREWAKHEDVCFSGDLSTVGVLGIHCDGVSYSSSVRAGASRTVLAASMNVVSATEDVRRRRQPLFVLRKARLCGCGCQGFHTIQEIMGVIAWSMQCLVQGVSPSRRHDGSPWSSHDRDSRMSAGLVMPKACLLQVRGDWEWLQDCFRLRSVNSDVFCWMCDATQYTAGPKHYHNFEPDAEHRTTMISHQSYMRACAVEGSQPSHLLRCPGTLIDHLTVDVMHAGDLGTFQDAIGALFWLEISHKGWYRSQARGLVKLNSMLNDYYAAHADLKNMSRVTPLVHSQIVSKNIAYPHLKAKAAQTRHLAEFCLGLARLHQAGNGVRPPFRFNAAHRLAAQTATHCDLLVQLFTGLSQFLLSCSAQPFDIAPCRAAMYLYLQSLEKLNKLWRNGLPEAQQTSQPFHIRPKSHVCQHMVEEKIESFGSPSSFWCYRDEDFVGFIKNIASKTKHPATLEQRMIEKLRILAALT